MDSDWNLFLVITTVSIVTFLLRALPFLMKGTLTSSEYITYIGSKMPLGVMCLLVVYTFLDIDVTTAPYGLPQIGAAIVVAAIYLCCKNILLAIAGGLMAHLIIVNYDFLISCL